MPVNGDDIVGTRVIAGRNDPDADYYAVTTHRRGCYHAQRALELKLRTQFDPNMVLNHSRAAVLPLGAHNARFQKARTADEEEELSVVDLQWDSTDRGVFAAEVAVFCEDRKLLLADCSDVVSELCSIMKTKSETRGPHVSEGNE